MVAGTGVIPDSSKLPGIFLATWYQLSIAGKR